MSNITRRDLFAAAAMAGKVAQGRPYFYAECWREADGMLEWEENERPALATPPAGQDAPPCVEPAETPDQFARARVAKGKNSGTVVSPQNPPVYKYWFQNSIPCIVEMVSGIVAQRDEQWRECHAPRCPAGQDAPGDKSAGEHDPSCPRCQFWDAGEYEAPCTCPAPDASDLPTPEECVDAAWKMWSSGGADEHRTARQLIGDIIREDRARRVVGVPVERLRELQVRWADETRRCGSVAAPVGDIAALLREYAGKEGA